MNPFRRKNPYITHGVVPAKLSTQITPLGFVGTVRGKYDSLIKDIKSVEDRLTYRYTKGVPAAYVGGKTFEPSQSVVDLDVFQDGSPDVPVNVVIPSGQDFHIPIILEAPGVFVAKSMTVTLYQRFHDPVYGEQWLPLPYAKSFFNTDRASVLGSEVQTIKRSLMYDLPGLASVVLTSKGNSVGGFEAGNHNKLYGTNFFWNLKDGDSERSLAGDLIPDQSLFPQGWENQVDGQIYHFETPWLFERANTIVFTLRMLNDVLQLAPNAAVFPVNGIDDREQNNTVRNQSVKVRIEIHGTKHYNERDTFLREAS